MAVELPLITFERENHRVTARRSALLAQTPSTPAEAHSEAIAAKAAEYERTIAATLHRAGFIRVDGPGGPHHQLPLGITDPAEQRATTTLAYDLLEAQGIEVRLARELLDPELELRHPGWDFGDWLGELRDRVAVAGHTSEVVTALSELTAPGDGVLQRVSEVLDTAAARCDELSTPADRDHAARLRFLAAAIASHSQQISAVRRTLADRHTALPAKGTLQQPCAPEATPSVRVEAALSTSPHAPRNTASPLSVTPASPPGSRPSAPRR
ncbi:hypothetical protein [Streptomyces sp. SID11385]|uniref:hypothetical protein n=1 Tax=Streptomyces sp. SID11385 TaxID=2706031 RepID=UPI0013C6A887|nr:hypothetical protein [Streptomyces sp. SID11385]NEA37712.1 hypothetical protein [Streptomyces sp. SID11385]NEA43526.1 hypothetical protein [Streptomyces sp. SID11385]